MTTGQSPKRRETDAQKEKRDEQARLKEQERLDAARPMSPLEVELVRPRINASGRLDRR